MKIERIWAMPNKWTFTIKPIVKLLDEEIGVFMGKTRDNLLWADPFAGNNSPAQDRNDLNPESEAQSHEDALAWLQGKKEESYDGILYDPPYSFRQLTECYKGIGREVTGDMTRMDYFSKCKDEIARIIKSGGRVICFGWNSMGLGKNRGFEMTRILLVPHGGSRNDTIVTVEIKL